MAPTPKPPGQRRRRNADQSQWRSLPVEGRDGPVPGLPDRESGWLDSTLAWWETLWRSPMAAVYEDADLDPLVRLAHLRDAVARDDAPATALTAMQQLEDRFGLSPKSRRALQWEIHRAEGEAAAAPVAKVRRLRAVDPAA